MLERQDRALVLEQDGRLGGDPLRQAVVGVDIVAVPGAPLPGR